MQPCPSGTRARGSWGARRRSHSSPPASTTPPTGRTTTLLLEGTAGIGVSRFLDEAIVRIDGPARPDDRPARDRLARPRGRAVRPDHPRHRSDAARRCPTTGCPTCSGRRRPRSSGSCRSSVRGSTAIGRVDRRGRRRPLPNGARRGPSRASSGSSGGSAKRHPVVLVLEDLHLADAATRALVTFLARISRDQRLAIIGTHQPDVVARDDSWTSDLAAILTGSRPERLALPPLDRDELAALIEGIEGERASASLLLLVAERSGGLPLVAEELLAARRELPSASLTGSFDELVIARLAVRSQECRRVLRLLALAERPLTWDQLAAVAAAFEVDTSRAAPRSVTGPRVGEGVLDADLWAGRTEALANGFLVERDDAIGFRHGSIGKAVAWDLLPIARTRYHAALAAEPRRAAVGRARHTGSARTIRMRPGRRRSRQPRPRPTDTPPRTSWPRSSSPCRSPRGRRRAPPPGAGPRPASDHRRPAGPRLGGGVRGRSDVAGDGLPRSRDRRARRPTRPRPARAAPRAAGAHPPRGRRPGRCDARRPTRGRARPARAESRACHGRRRPCPAPDARRDLLRCAATGPRGDQGRPRL